jgi:L-cystine transport system permease protein
MRCTPSIVLLFIVFYGLPKLTEELFDYNINDMNRAVFAIITFVLLFGAYISEVFRAAYKAVPHGQYEAAVSIGISPVKSFFHIMLPQAAMIALPNFGNSVINLLKEGALAYTIGLIDLIGRGNLIIAQNFGAYGIEVYLACMIIYWLMTLALEQCFYYAEKRLNKGQGMAQTKNAKKFALPKWQKGEN